MRNVAPSCWPESSQALDCGQASDTAEDTVVGEFVCSDSELALDSFKWLLKYFGSRGIGHILDGGEILVDDRGFQLREGRGDLAWVRAYSVIFATQPNALVLGESF